ncbi:MAG: replication-associated recombination protein A [Firmicutes bacterium]|nr:replication-associated recombination protein A [Bacillota bacterium]
MPQLSMFENKIQRPLADRLRPRTLDEFYGQKHLLGEGKVLRKLIESDNIGSMIFWGPPGVGKTTLAGIIAASTDSEFIEFSAVTSGIKEIRSVMEQAETNRQLGTRTIVFVDEIHRFNKAQQDAFLPFVERGSIVLIGATTENPSFEVNGALLSRCRVFVLNQLNEDDICDILRRAVTDRRGFGLDRIVISDDIIHAIAVFSDGDARAALSTLEMVILNSDTDSEGRIVVTEEIVQQCTSKKMLLYDKNGEEHYNLISALHKSMRNSDPDAAVYWLARMLEAGEDPMYVARRVTRFAAEDIGMADPRALEICVAAFQACHLIGMPECTVHLTEAVVYCSLAPKSNAMDVAYMLAREDAQRMLDEPVPLVIRNAPTKLMKEQGYGKGYQYAHDAKDKLTNMQCLPDSLLGREYYRPTKQGFEERYGERLAEIKKWKREHGAPGFAKDRPESAEPDAGKMAAQSTEKSAKEKQEAPAEGPSDDTLQVKVFKTAAEMLAELEKDKK